MGVVVPITLFYLLGLQRPSQLFTIAASTFLTWGVADLLAGILERPRLKNRTPVDALRQDLDRREHE